ncbi:MAG: DUF1203 domain-containing protein [Rhodobacteraceae bacterium]|nr:DUF1203 domain-containing protein [Paracoccaceae bacterium]
MQPVFLPLPRSVVDHFRAGGADAYGLPPERRRVAGGGVPCRATLRLLPEDAPYLILAHRPFDGLNPYTETGPIFVSAEALPMATPSPDLPPFLTAPDYIVRGYSSDERIVYGTGEVTPTEAIIARCTALLSRPDVAFVHIRSSRNNCFHCRVERG